MFKNAIIYSVSGLPVVAAALAEALAPELYHPCDPSQERATGWAPPRGEAHGELLEAVGGHWVGCFIIESRSVPGDVIRKRTEELAAKIEQKTGRKPGKTERRDLRDDARQGLQPHAFSRIRTVWVWIDPVRGWVVVDTSSQAVADTVVTSLVKALPRGFQIKLLQTAISPRARMAEWLAADACDGLPGDLELGRTVELRGTGDEAARVRLNNHDLGTDEVRQHVAQGKLPVSLALSHAGRVGFVLTHALQLRGIRLLDIALDAADHDSADRFDAEVALTTGELRATIDALLAALAEADVDTDAKTPKRLGVTVAA